MSDIKNAIRDIYGKIGGAGGSGGSCCAPGGCAPEVAAPSADDVARRLGYTGADLGSAPDGSNLGLGCGNPQAIAALEAGETVLDLGSGGGFDCFLAARQVGETGTVIGVDMTPEMLERARENARRAGARNVEFRLGEIEHLPVADESVDVILSNCVINLSPDKVAVYREALRVLKHGGRLAISDVVATAPLPEGLREDLALHTGCVAGAATIAEIEAILADAGFEEIRIEPRSESGKLIAEWFPGGGIEDHVLSATIEARKP